MSYLNRKPEDEVWYVHSPLKKGGRELVTAPPPSQIPYLNGVFDDEATINQPRLIYVRDTDTDYIRRCKTGESDNFLVHIDPSVRKSKEPVPYARPVWWDAMCQSAPSDGDSLQQGKAPHVFGAPDWFVHREHRSSPGKPSMHHETSKQAPASTSSRRK